MKPAKDPSQILPPHDPDAEAAALGCILSAQNSQAESFLDQLDLDCFYDERHRTLYRALSDLRLLDQHLEPAVLDQYLRDQNLQTQAGGKNYHVSLPDLTPSPQNFPYYYETLCDRKIRRAALRDAVTVMQLARDPAINGAQVAQASNRLLESRAALSPRRLPNIEKSSDLISQCANHLPPELVANLIHQGSKTVIGSGSKARKTWLLLDLAVSVASGTPFWNLPTLQSPVLYINFELPRPFLAFRLQGICDAKHLPVPQFLDFQTLRGHAAPLYRLLPGLLQKIKPGQYRLIILDPIYKGLGARDENSAGDTAQLCNELESLAVSTNAAVVFAAHFSKGNQAAKDAIDRISGSGVFGRDPDSIITLTKHEIEGAYTVDSILRNLPELPPFVVQWRFPLMLPCDLNPDNLKQIPGRKPDFSPNDILQLLPPEGLDNKDWLDLASDHAITERTFYRLRSSLLISKSILKSKINSKWLPIKKI